MDQPDEHTLVAQVDAAIEARWQVAQRRHRDAMAAIERRRCRANLRFGLVLIGCAAAAGLAALVSSWLGG
jgi:hypothetical protein